MANLYLGTSGWRYTDWVGNFYPLELRPIHYLHYYSKQFSAVELDTTFYTIPASDVVLKWKEKVGNSFLFAAKFPKIISHECKFAHCSHEVKEFIETMSLLEEKLGPFLIQMPYGFKIYEYDSIASFFSTLPLGYRYAIEARHRSWLVPKFYELLREFNICLVLSDHPWLPRLNEVTSNFIYIRWLGDRTIVNKDYSKPQIDRSKKLQWWADQIRHYLKLNVDVLGFFNNNYSGNAPTAIWLLEDILAHRPIRDGVLPGDQKNNDQKEIHTSSENPDDKTTGIVSINSAFDKKDSN